MNTLKFWSIFAVGVAAGAVVALIYAPQSGEETRRQLREKYDETADSIRDRAGDFRDRAGEWVDTASDYAGKASDFAGKFYKKGREVAEDYASDVQSTAKSVTKAAARRAQDLGRQAV